MRNFACILLGLATISSHGSVASQESQRSWIPARGHARLVPCISAWRPSRTPVSTGVKLHRIAGENCTLGIGTYPRGSTVRFVQVLAVDDLADIRAGVTSRARADCIGRPVRGNLTGKIVGGTL